MPRYALQSGKPQGQYRTVPGEGRARMVYVCGNGAPAFVTEQIYREKGIGPLFEELPTEDEYDERS